MLSGGIVGTMELSEQKIVTALTEYNEAIGRTRLKKKDVDAFMESTSKTLFDYCKQFPEDTEFQYRIQRRFLRVEMRIQIPGEKKDIYEYGKMSEEREILRKIHSLKLASSLDMQYFYIKGSNTIIFLSPPVRNRSVLTNPMVIASLIGLVAGLLCSFLQADISGFLVNDLASPVLNTIIKVMTGIMGPVIFLSLITSISAVDSIGELNRLGTKLFRRFLVITIFISAMAMLVAFLAFSFSRGQTDIAFSPRVLVDMLLSVIPTNLITPFAENNFPQLLVLGLALGIALLLLNRKESVINNFLLDLRDWVNELLRLILKLSPIIPGLTLFKIFARRDFSSFIQGWKFIAAAYACMAIVLIIKLIKVKTRCRTVSFSAILHKILPAVQMALYSGSEIITVKKCDETAKGPLGISKTFADLYGPLNQSMFSPIGPVYYVLAPFFVAEITGTPVSIQFMFILLILSVQLSLAYPGITAGSTIIFNALGLSTDYVGLFSAYSVFIKNASAAYSVTYRLLEITETSYVTESMDTEKCNAVY